MKSKTRTGSNLRSVKKHAPVAVGTVEAAVGAIGSSSKPFLVDAAAVAKEGTKRKPRVYFMGLKAAVLEGHAEPATVALKKARSSKTGRPEC